MKIQAAEAMVKVLTDWGVDHIYGIPGSSTNSLMRALKLNADKIKYIQVRHEEAGALAASVDSKLTGKIGVCFGSGGPGHTHLINGMYDAKFDKVPMLVIAGSTSSTNLNTDYFQEMDPVPLYSDVAVYNRMVTNPEVLPFVIDHAIRVAYKERGVAIVHVPVDVGYLEIEDDHVTSAKDFKVNHPIADQESIADAIRLIYSAKKPVIFAGRGTLHAREELKELSEKYKIPVILSFLGKGAIDDLHPNFLGNLGRLGSKSAKEAIEKTDLIIQIGAEYPFGQEYFPQNVKSIQINTDSTTFGKRLPATVSILGDSKKVMSDIIKRGVELPETSWLKANRINRENWLKWLYCLQDSKKLPMRPEPIMKALNKTASDDAIYIVDVGNSVILTSRGLFFTGKQKLTTSGTFATMGIGIPGGIAARLSYPDREVYTISGDGAFSMMMQDLITQVKYKLPMVNLVICNESYGFIEVAQESANNDTLGVDLYDVDYAKFAESCGAIGYTVKTYEELVEALNKSKGTKVPVVIDIKVENIRHLPGHQLVLDSTKFTEKEIKEFKEKYDVYDMPVLKDILNDIEKER